MPDTETYGKTNFIEQILEIEEFENRQWCAYH